MWSSTLTDNHMEIFRKNRGKELNYLRGSMTLAEMKANRIRRGIGILGSYTDGEATALRITLTSLPPTLQASNSEDAVVNRIALRQTKRVYTGASEVAPDNKR